MNLKITIKITFGRCRRIKIKSSNLTHQVLIIMRKIFWEWINQIKTSNWWRKTSTQLWIRKFLWTKLGKKPPQTSTGMSRPKNIWKIRALLILRMFRRCQTKKKKLLLLMLFRWRLKICQSKFQKERMSKTIIHLGLARPLNFRKCWELCGFKSIRMLTM